MTLINAMFFVPFMWRILIILCALVIFLMMFGENVLIGSRFRGLVRTFLGVIVSNLLGCLKERQIS